MDVWMDTLCVFVFQTWLFFWPIFPITVMIGGVTSGGGGGLGGGGFGGGGLGGGGLSGGGLGGGGLAGGGGQTDPSATTLTNRFFTAWFPAESVTS